MKKEEMCTNTPFSYCFHKKHAMFTNGLCYLAHSGVKTHLMKKKMLQLMDKSYHIMLQV
jgi:hypothetical protein